MIVWPWGKRAHQKSQLSQFLSGELLRDALSFLSRGKATLAYRQFGISSELFEDFSYPELHPIEQDTRVQHRIVELNKHIENAAAERAYERFARVAYERIPRLIAPSLSDFEVHKKLITLQLAATERVHMHIVSDPDSLASELLRFSVALHDSSIMISSSGSKTLFSSAKKTIKDDEDLLKRSSEGILAISSVEQLKPADKKVLAEVLDSGMYTPDPSKAGKRHTACRLLSCSTPTRIVGKQPDILRRQITLDPFVLDEIHVVSIVKNTKRPTQRSFTINRSDYEFVKGFYSYVENTKVGVPSELEEKIYSYVELLKTEKDTVVEVTSTRIVGMIRLAKARARLSLRSEIREDDVKEAYALIRAALALPKE
ncbi:MAG: hypothetical protein ACMXYM_02905 [Candidatus Woesearchaeota archaeon]